MTSRQSTGQQVTLNPKALAQLEDLDIEETQEWLDSLDSVLAADGNQRAQYLLHRLASRLEQTGTQMSWGINTPYRNTIPASQEASMPGDLFLERQIRSLIRWNSMVMVMRANQADGTLGGHISTFQSSATLYDVGFNYFFRAPNDQHGGDLIYIQGHSAPGIYARSYLEGRLDEEQLDNFRREANGKGLSSYPHPWLMPDYWQFPTVSMGLGPLQAIYQAHIMKYLDLRGLCPAGDRKVWAFIGDGEMDEPESLGAISLAGREKLDNLIFVVNCNLQRLDGPVRGNSKIIQELEGLFRGAGWNVIKVIWGRHWDPLFERDRSGLLQRRMDEAVDGEYQNYKSRDGAYVRSQFFGKYEELLNMVEDLSDDQIYRLNRGGHDPYKVYAAYAAAARHKGQPTVILAKTVKGYGLGPAGEAQNFTHAVKALDLEALREFRDRFDIPIPDSRLADIPYYRPPADSPEMLYMQKRRTALGGYLPQRRTEFDTLKIPPLSLFDSLLSGSGEREVSTTMMFVRLLSTLVRDPNIGRNLVPIVPDEARTFGMEGMFRQLGIYSAEGQLYEPADAGQLTYYREGTSGQVLEEGINEAGAFAAWMAAATAYSTHQYPLIPMYIFYSMFGFQRVGDLCWAAGDLQARGFLLGGTSGRTTLNGEGLQHQDGHSHLLAATLPNCISYDPAFAYELAVLLHHGLEDMFVRRNPHFYYLTLMNERYVHPAMPAGAEAGIIKGMYCIRPSQLQVGPGVQLLASGTILLEALAAAEMLEESWGLAVNVWSVTSFTELRREGLEVIRWNMLHPEEAPRISYVEQCLGESSWPVVAATDYMKAFADQIREFVPRPFRVLGTDGFGRSDTRKELRRFFEVNREFIVLAAMDVLCQAQVVDRTRLGEVIRRYGLNQDKADPARS